ncbi:hypothetical protein Ancab_002343 [Ancistrocladus abbreviatus]
MRNASILLSVSLQSQITPSMIAEMANIEEPSHGVPRGDIMEALFEIKAPASSTPVNGVVSSDVTVDPSRSLWFRQYVPTSAVAAADAVPVVVYYHGGGFVIWSPDRKPYDDLCRRLARELSAVVVSATYRMAPEYRCPTQYDDGIKTLKFIDGTKIDGFPPNADIGKCFLAGDSSGGNMSHHMAARGAKHEFQNLYLNFEVSTTPPFMTPEMANIEESSHGVPRQDIIEALFEVKAPPSSTPINGVVSSDVTIDPSRSLWFHLDVTISAVATANAMPVVVYYHGGGFVI